MSEKKEKDDDVLYLDVDEYLNGKNIGVSMNNNKERETEKNGK